MISFEPGSTVSINSDSVLYFGGIYDWYDPLVVLEAMPALLEADPRTTVVFVDHPNPDLTPLSVAGRVRAQAEARSWIGHQVRFADWQPFEHRFDLPLACDLAVVTHRPGLETDLSLRTRLVDLLWLGILVAMNLQTSFLTPPFGFALFYLRGVAPPSVTTPLALSMTEAWASSSSDGSRMSMSSYAFTSFTSFGLLGPGM